jgi:hypothetical protein
MSRRLSAAHDRVVDLVLRRQQRERRGAASFLAVVRERSVARAAH